MTNKALLLCFKKILLVYSEPDESGLILTTKFLEPFLML